MIPACHYRPRVRCVQRACAAATRLRGWLEPVRLLAVRSQLKFFDVLWAVDPELEYNKNKDRDGITELNTVRLRS